MTPLRPRRAAGAWLLAAAVAAPLPALDPTLDRVHARHVVPNAVRRQGEVRLVERGEATVVQTLLATRVLARAVAEIRKKEERNWPPDRPGHEDAHRYVAALETATGTLEAAAGDDDRRLHLLIEFVATADGGGVTIGEWVPDPDDEDEPLSARPIATVAVGRDYLLRNMRLILADAFDVDESEVGRLGPLGPAR